MKILILYSGGLDSLIMKRYAEVTYPEAEVTCVFFDIEQPYKDKEVAALPDYVLRRSLPWLGNTNTKGKGTSSGDIYIPGRNLALAVVAACQFLPDQIWLGALLGETHSSATDKNFTFLDKASDVLTYVLSPFKGSVAVRFPLAEAGLNKLTATKWALENGVSAATIRNSSSCLSGEPGCCGACVVCLRRYGIFKQLGIPIDTFNQNPLTVKSNRKIIKDMLTGDYYDEHRKSEILPALPETYKQEILNEEV